MCFQGPRPAPFPRSRLEGFGHWKCRKPVLSARSSGVAISGSGRLFPVIGGAGFCCIIDQISGRGELRFEMKGHGTRF
jgi:hypothetical protein